MLVYRCETVLSKEAEGQVNFPVTKYDRADYIGLKVPYSIGVVSFVIILVTERDHILCHSVLTTRKMGTGLSGLEAHLVYMFCSR